MTFENLTLAGVFERPAAVTYRVKLREGECALLRPLLHNDVEPLAAFLEGLSPTTRHFSVFASYDRAMAQALCDAINRYDKLRFVVELRDSTEAAKEGAKEIVALFEFSFDLPQGDLSRFEQHGMALDAAYDCRFGPTITDDYQNRGLGSMAFPYLVEVAKRFGKRRIILWGGVLADNARAIRYYEKNGFQRVGQFTDYEGLLCLDMALELE